MSKIKIGSFISLGLALGMISAAGVIAHFKQSSSADNSSAPSPIKARFAETQTTPEQSPPSKPRASTISQRPAADSTITGQSLVKLINPRLKREFARANQLLLSQLKPTALEDIYLVEEVPSELQLTSPAMVASPRLKYRALLTPDDPIYPQWFSTNISAPSGWDISTGDSDIQVAVIDTGFTLGHADMTSRWHENAGEGGDGCPDLPAVCDALKTNDTDDDLNGRVDDWRGWDFAQNDNNPNAGSVNADGDGVNHGTMVSGLVGATGNNGVGIAAPNWSSLILPIQALTDNGGGFSEDVVAAVEYATDRQVEVINLSLGSSGQDLLLRNAINEAIDAGITVVAAAGNCGGTNYFLQGCDYQGQVIYPAKQANVIAVAAVDEDDQRASFSSYEPNFVDIAAPGAGTIRTTAYPSGYTTSANGTSFASPIVAGAASLMLSVDPNLTPAKIKNHLRYSADKVAGMLNKSYHHKYGHGRVSIYLALATVDGHQPIYRLFDPNQTAYYYTRHASLRNRLINGGYKYQGVGFWSAAQDDPEAQPIYRVYDPKRHNFFYTRQAEVRDNLVDNGHNYQGIAFWGVPEGRAGAQPIYRLFDPKQLTHFYTRHLSIKNQLVSRGWKYQGVGWWSPPPP